MSTPQTRTYVVEDARGERVAIVRDCVSQAHAIRAQRARTPLRARIASADDVLDAIAAGVEPFSAIATMPVASPAVTMAAIAGAMRSLDLEPGDRESSEVFHRPRDSEGTPVPEPFDPFLVPRHDGEPTQAELEAADHAHDAAREARVFGGGR